ncbi:hypothetical protein [Streptococcus equi]
MSADEKAAYIAEREAAVLCYVRLAVNEAGVQMDRHGKRRYRI